MTYRGAFSGNSSIRVSARVRPVSDKDPPSAISSKLPSNCSSTTIVNDFLSILTTNAVSPLKRLKRNFRIASLVAAGRSTELVDWRAKSGEYSASGGETCHGRQRRDHGLSVNHNRQDDGAVSNDAGRSPAFCGCKSVSIIFVKLLQACIVICVDLRRAVQSFKEFYKGSQLDAVWRLGRSIALMSVTIAVGLKGRHHRKRVHEENPVIRISILAPYYRPRPMASRI